ncbi:extracellular solute-binding protein [Erysipelothrix sp. HDW6A]|uniref:ABC transporter substrate-binding protein n=1 Tax=Erysipelothrix sp. HDW6A TaxID=2714928 RepID=UPI001409DD25|nr:ABC transporter substrate-binding protein [Erysipelothrix sp. HDW6A]QIK56922.1 extracellular solute-binding protein [Erysipelothrix sp. HDW6A]
MKFKKFIVVLMAALVLVGCSSKGEENKKLVVYSPNSEGIMNAVIPLFEEKYKIKVEPISAGTGELVKRIQAEKDNPYGDVLFGGTYTQYMSNLDLFQEYVSKENDNVVEEYRNTNGKVTYTVLDGSMLIVNKELTDGIEINSYADLLKPELKGKIATADPANSSSAFAQLTNILLAMSPDKDYMNDEAWTYVENLIKQWDGKIQSGSSAVYKSVVDGEMWVGLTYEDPVAKLVKDGAKNIEIVYPKEGSVFLPAGTGIIKGAKNVDNAKLFVDFLLSEEVQNIFGTQLTNRPVRIGAQTGDHMQKYDTLPLIFEDMEYVYKNKTQIVERYTQLFAGLQ